MWSAIFASLREKVFSSLLGWVLFTTPGRRACVSVAARQLFFPSRVSMPPTKRYIISLAPTQIAPTWVWLCRLCTFSAFAAAAKIKKKIVPSHNEIDGMKRVSVIERSSWSPLFDHVYSWKVRTDDNQPPAPKPNTTPHHSSSSGGSEIPVDNILPHEVPVCVRRQSRRRERE